MKYIVWTVAVLCFAGELSADVLQSQAGDTAHASVWSSPRQGVAPFTEPRAISTAGYPFENPKEEVSTIGTLPQCFKPQIRVIDAYIPEDYWDWTGYKVNGPKTGFISLFQKPNGFVDSGMGNYVEFRHTNRHVKPGRGALVTVDFLPDGSCSNNYTDFTKLVCFPQKLAEDGFLIETPLYPNATHKGMACRHAEEIYSRMVSHNVKLDYNLNAGETLNMDLGHWYKLRLTGPKTDTVTIPSSFPYILTFKANDASPGYFSLKAESVIVDEPCGTTMTVDGNITVEFPPKYRPLPGCLYPNGLLCSMLFKAKSDKFLEYTIDIPRFDGHERLIVYQTATDRYAHHVNVRNSQTVKMQTTLSMMSYYNEKNSVFNPWKVTVTEIDKY